LQVLQLAVHGLAQAPVAVVKKAPTVGHALHSPLASFWYPSKHVAVDVHEALPTHAAQFAVHALHLPALTQ